MRKRILPSLTAILLLLIVFTASVSSARAQGGTTTYLYDDNGRLRAVISASGETAVYEYDAAGNITSIRRLGPGNLAILDFSPREGMPGDRVTFVGSGFGGGVTSVSFNGVSASVISVTPSKVIATVPQGATTGPVTITTTNGSVTTAIPFTVGGIRLTPAFAALKFGQSVQFEAEVLPLTLEQEITWTVNDVAGGSDAAGTISTTGLYRAPDVPQASVVIRATSVADNTRFAEATVRVSDPNDVQVVIAGSVTVSRGENLTVSAAAPPIAVQYGVAGNQQTAQAAPVTVQYGAAGHQQTALSPPVTVQYRGAPVQASAADAVSVARAPFIRSVTPNNLTRGSTVTFSITGVGLSGVTILRFTTADGTSDQTITVANIVVSADGSSLTATVNVSADSVAGSRNVLIATPDGESQRLYVGINLVNVQ